MIPTLLSLTFRGTLATAVILVVDLVVGHRIRPAWRRVWWLLVGLVWIIPFRLPAVAGLPHFAMPDPLAGMGQLPRSSAAVSEAKSSHPWAPFSGWGEVVGAVWLAGAAVFLCAVVVRTVGACRRWDRERFCTDPELLNLLEDCKASAGVTAPIGLVLTATVSTPALLGWLRPRILLPQALVASFPREQLRAVLLHELAHFRSADIPCHWLFTIAQALNWPNPVMLVASRRWRHACEIAADASAVAQMPERDGATYGQALVDALRWAGAQPMPRGALALGESFGQLKERIGLVARRAGYHARTGWAAAVVALGLVVLIAVPTRGSLGVGPMLAPDRETAGPVAEQWLQFIDREEYQASWSAGAEFAQRSVSPEKWGQLLRMSREVRGRTVSRRLSSVEIRQDIPDAKGNILRGTFAIVLFDTAFGELPSARETVPLFLEADGRWRPCGYTVALR